MKTTYLVVMSMYNSAVCKVVTFEFNHIRSKNGIILFISWLCLFHHFNFYSYYDPTKMYDPTKILGEHVQWRGLRSLHVCKATMTELKVSNLIDNHHDTTLIKKISKCCQDERLKLFQTCLNYGMATCVLLAIVHGIKYMTATTVESRQCFSH